MARADAILEAVLRIHEAPLAPDGWALALPSIAALSGSQVVNLHADDANGQAVGFHAACGLDAANLLRFRGAGDVGILPRWWQTVPAGKPTHTSAMWSRQEFLRLPFYNEVVRATGTFFGLHTALVRGGRRTHLIVARALGRQDYAAEDVATIQTLIPHLATALRVSERLAAADLRAAGVSAALDRLDTGVILVDAAARVLFANRVADGVLSGGNGLSADKEGLRVADPRAAQALRRLIARCACDAAAGGVVEVLRGEGHAPLRIVVAPFPSKTAQLEMSWLGTARPVALLMIAAPERKRHEQKETLRVRFGLTAAEAEFALEIGKGDGRQAAAARLGISVATARTHLERIFEKTGARRQAELVRLLLQSSDNGPTDRTAAADEL